MDPTGNPLALFMTVAAGLGACLYQFVSLKKDLWRQRRDSEAARARVEEALRRFEDEMERMREELEASVMGGAAARLGPSMNLNTRSRVLRMHRRGERPDQIAAALSLPRNEVDLLLKIHFSMVEQAASEANAAGRPALGAP